MQQFIAFDRRSIQLLGELAHNQDQVQPKSNEEQGKELEQTPLTTGEEATENTD